MPEDGRAQLAHLLEDLGSEDWKVATQAQQSLVRVGPVALRPLCELLEADTAASWRAAWVLGRLGDRRAVPFLAHQLSALQHDERPESSARDERAALCEAEIAEALGVLGDPRGATALCEALWSPSPGVRAHVKGALARIGRGALSHLYTCLDELPVDGLAAVVDLLAKEEDARVIRPLCRLLEHEDWDVRVRATEALAVIAPKCPVLELRSAIPLLERGCRRWSLTAEPLRSASRRALQQIEAATRHLQDVPLPASSPQPASGTLPVPAGSIAPAEEGGSPPRSGWLLWLRNWLRKGL